jgi:hypothetical protein
LYGNEGYQRGSPYEDCSTEVAVLSLLHTGKIKHAYLMCTSVTTESIDLQTFFRNVSDQTQAGGFLGCMSGATSQLHLFDILQHIPPSVRSIPNECIWAAAKGEFGNVGEPYENPRLSERIEEKASFPPCNPLTHIMWFFDLAKIHERSPLIQFLCEKTSDWFSQPVQEKDVVSQSILFHQFINIKYGGLTNST